MKISKRLVSLFLTLLTLCSLCSMVAIPTFAASTTPYDALSSSRYAKVFTLATSGRQTVYTTPDLKTPGNKERGPSNAWIGCAADELRLIDVGVTNGQQWALVSYPVSGGGRRTGYIPLSAITANTHAVKSTSSGKFYCSPRLGKAISRSYYTDKFDVVWLLAVNGNQVQLLYPTSTGFRIAWASKSDYEKYCGKLSNDPVDVTAQKEQAVQERLNSIAKGTLTYNSSTVMKVGSKFTGYRASEQCKGYAKNVFYLCFGIHPGSTQPRSNGVNYLLYNTTGMTRLGSVTNKSESALATLFAKARPGDFVQIRRNHGGSHSAIVYSVSSTGVTFLEANLDGNNTVSMNTYTWADLSKNVAMSVYTASNYQLT